MLNVAKQEDTDTAEAIAALMRGEAVEWPDGDNSG